MRILHVITALGVGGAERMLMKLLAAQSLAAIDQHVVAMLPGGALLASMRATGAPVHESNFLGGLPVFSGVKDLAALARRTAPDLVQGWLYHGNLGALVVQTAVRRPIPVVWSIRQSLPSLVGENAWARVAIRLNQLMSRRPDCLLFNSVTSLQQHREFGFRMVKASYLPNGFDTSIFAPDPEARARLRATWGADTDTAVFGLLARFHPAKDHAGFLTAARRMLDARPRSMFVLAGTGVDESNAELVKAIAGSGLQHKVRLLGERSDIAQVLAALDVYVSSSAWIEAFSNSVGEAMSCALPCIVTNVGDSSRLVAETGRVVPPRDAACMAAAMIEMTDIGAAARESLGARARQRIQSAYGIEAIAQQYGALWHRLVASRQARS